MGTTKEFFKSIGNMFLFPIQLVFLILIWIEKIGTFIFVTIPKAIIKFFEKKDKYNGVE